MVNKLLSEGFKVTSLLWYEKESECLLCAQKSKGPVCSRCQEDYFQPNVQRCLTCGKLILGESTYCKDCTSGKGPKGLNKVITLGCYEKAWKKFICTVKYQSQPYALLALSEILVTWAIKNLPPPDAIVPVPMHPHKLAIRGFNQAEVLASILSRTLGIRINSDLIRIKDTPSQTVLGRKERIQNLQGAFIVKQEKIIKDEIIWLVDDVTTTGTTLGECAETLKRNGAKEVYGLCLGAGREEK